MYNRMLDGKYTGSLRTLDYCVTSTKLRLALGLMFSIFYWFGTQTAREELRPCHCHLSLLLVI